MARGKTPEQEARLKRGAILAEAYVALLQAHTESESLLDAVEHPCLAKVRRELSATGMQPYAIQTALLDALKNL